MSGSRWVIESEPVPHLRVETDDDIIALFSTKHGLSFIERYGITDFCYLKQVHGNTIILASSCVCPKGETKGDGFIIRERGIFVAVRVADCYPIFLYDPKIRVVALLHAGWRGLKSSILDIAVEKMKKFGAIPEDMVAFIGPGISWYAYEVKEDVGSIFPDYVVVKEGKMYLDLHRFIFERLEMLGLRKSAILPSPLCTYSNKDLFYSKRREGKPEGYMWAIAGMK